MTAVAQPVPYHRLREPHSLIRLTAAPVIAMCGYVTTISVRHHEWIAAAGTAATAIWTTWVLVALVLADWRVREETA